MTDKKDNIDISDDKDHTSKTESCGFVRNLSNQLLSTIDKIEHIIIEKEEKTGDPDLRRIESLEKLNITSY
jgi:hypothetical protein